MTSRAIRTAETVSSSLPETIDTELQSQLWKQANPCYRGADGVVVYRPASDAVTDCIAKVEEYVHAYGATYSSQLEAGRQSFYFFTSAVHDEVLNWTVQVPVSPKSDFSSAGGEFSSDLTFELASTLRTQLESYRFVRDGWD